jgi:hypothetical protein
VEHLFRVAVTRSPNGLIESAEPGLQGADKSQLAVVESPACDRMAFA